MRNSGSVALVATYEDTHVLPATVYSKSALRVVAEMATRAHDRVGYFPSYEIITGPQSRGAFFEDDLREVRPEGVAHVMSIFARHYLGGTAAETCETQSSIVKSLTMSSITLSALEPVK